MNFFSDFFSSFDQQDSLIFVLFAVVSFLFGFVLSWLVSGRKSGKYRLAAQKTQAELKALNAEYQSFKEQLELKEADLQHAQVEVEEAKRRTGNLQDENRRLRAELEENQSELIRLESAVTSQQVTIEDLNDQILGLRTRTQNLSEEAPQEDTAPGVPQGVQEPPESPESLPYEPVDAVAEMQSAFNAALQRLSTIEEKLQRLEAENATLRDQYAAAPVGRSLGTSVDALFDLDEEEDEEEVVNQAREYLKTAIGTALPAADASEKDDLQQIEGIGPFIEKQLNQAGIYTFEQVSRLDEVLIDQLTKAIQFFPGRIVKDDWVGQAKKLLEQTPDLEIQHPVENVEAPPSAEEGEQHSLQVVEGIGPKIEALLNEAGIQTVQDLAGTEVERLQEILAAAGERFRLHDPGTWPEQARLAAEGEWEQLKSFKEYLDGGKYRE
ncbi:MAG: DUF1049 domain-containing protein [Lewinellaceae bacterium]|nr:DUF1049 domain-containing protein [Lewinellaceae bacterium]